MNEYFMITIACVVIAFILFICFLFSLGSDQKSNQKNTTNNTTNRTTNNTTNKQTATWNEMISTTSPNRTGSGTSDRKITSANFTEKLQTLSNVEDVKTETSEEEKRLVSEVRNFQKEQYRGRSFRASEKDIHIDLSWSKDLAELLEQTNVVYSNAQMNCNRPLLSERFSYYCGLHYRSFTAADLCYAKKQEILPHERQLRSLVKDIQEKKLYVDPQTKQTLISLRNKTGDIIALLGKRTDQLNHQTGMLRDKIRNECGERGKIWYNGIIARSGK